MTTDEQPAGPSAPAAPARLARGVLTEFDIAAATMANIAPAMSFFFGFALIAESAGVASPLTIVAAAIAIALLGNTLTQFTRSIPSTGSFVTFIGKSFGAYSAIVTAIVLGAGYIIAASAVVAISGGWTHTILQHYLHISIPWQLLTVVLTGAALAMIIGGAKPSTKAAALFFAFELGLLVIVGIVFLVDHSGSISLSPFDPGHLHDGFKGLSLGFPLAVFLFVGWENSAAMAEESQDPRTGVGRAVFASVGLMAALYLFVSYATVVAFDANTGRLAGAEVPFVDAALGVAGFAGFLAYMAGFTSIFGTLISATNSQARILFSSGREGLLPAWVGRTTPRQTPWAAFVLFLGIALGIAFVFGWSTDPVTFFGEAATLGAILISLTYLVANLALPVYYRRYHRDAFSPVRHLVLPLVGALAIGYPLEQLVKPGQPHPFDRYPLVALGVLVAAAVYAAWVNARDRTLGERVGSIVADAE